MTSRISPTLTGVLVSVIKETALVVELDCPRVGDTVFLVEQRVPWP